VGEAAWPPCVSDLDALYAQLPNLADDEHRITSPATDEYNCVAWVERDLDRWWEPDFYWPPDAPEPDGDDDLNCYIAMFQHLGFEPTESPDLEDGFTKIAIYAEGARFHHVAKQLPSGAWSSKAGRLHDVRHESLAAFEDSPVLGHSRPVIFLRRRSDPADEMELEEHGLLIP